MTQQVNFKAAMFNVSHPHYYSVLPGHLWLQCLTIINPQRTLTHANGCEASWTKSHNYPYLILSNGHPCHGSAIVDLIADGNLFAGYLHGTPSSEPKGKIISVFKHLGVYFMLGINTTQLVCKIKRVNAWAWDLKLPGFHKTRFLGSKNWIDN